jgi:hypothetical protein
MDKTDGADQERVAETEAGSSRVQELESLQDEQGVRDSPEAKVLFNLLKDVSQLKSEEPKEIMRFFLEVKPIYDIKLVNDRVFWSKLLCRVQSSLVTFVGKALQRGETWKQCV